MGYLLVIFIILVNKNWKVNGIFIFMEYFVFILDRFKFKFFGKVYILFEIYMLF